IKPLYYKIVNISNSGNFLTKTNEPYFDKDVEEYDSNKKPLYSVKDLYLLVRFFDKKTTEPYFADYCECDKDVEELKNFALKNGFNFVAYEVKPFWKK